MFYKSERQSFRHRGFESSEIDANGKPVVVMMFGSDPAPKNADGSDMKVLWDNDVQQEIKVSHHAEAAAEVPAAAADPAAPASP